MRRLRTGLEPLLLALLLTPAAPGCGPNPPADPSPADDAESPDRGAADDPAGPPPGSGRANEPRDGDGDQVPDDLDRCPGTPLFEVVIRSGEWRGCSQEQLDEIGSRSLPPPPPPPGQGQGGAAGGGSPGGSTPPPPGGGFQDPCARTYRTCEACLTGIPLCGYCVGGGGCVLGGSRGPLYASCPGGWGYQGQNFLCPQEPPPDAGLPPDAGATDGGTPPDADESQDAAAPDDAGAADGAAPGELPDGGAEPGARTDGGAGPDAGDAPHDDGPSTDALLPATDGGALPDASSALTPEALGGSW